MIMRMGYCKCIICGQQLDNDEQTYCESCELSYSELSEDALDYEQQNEEEEDYE